MKSDEEQIRELVATWLSATRAGDADTVLGLVTDDVVFLQPGRPPMLKDEFAALTRAQGGAGGPTIEGRSEIREVQVAGDMAYMWTALSVKVTPADGGAGMEREGYTLTVLRRVDGRWKLARDANLLAAKT